MTTLTPEEQEALLIASHTVEPVADTGRALLAVVVTVRWLRDQLRRRNREGEAA